MIYFVTAGMIILACVFALLAQLWAGFTYFVLSIFMMTALLWAGYMIFQYFTSFKAEIKDDYKYFKAETINEKNITIDDFENNEKVFIKQFKRSVLKDKLLFIFKICFFLALGVTFMMAMIFA